MSASARLALALSMGLAACGGDAADDDAAPRLTRLSLEPVGAPPDPAPARMVARLEVPATLGPWTVAAPTHELTAERGLRLVGDAPHRVSIPGLFDPATFDTLEVALATAGTLTLRAGFSRGEDDDTLYCAPAVVQASGSTTATIDARALLDETRPFTSLTLVAAGDALDWTLRAIALVDAPGLPGVPGPGEAPALIEVGDEARRGVGLHAGHAAQARARVPEDGRLAFSYGVPRGAVSSDARLVVRVFRDDEARVELLGPASGLVERFVPGAAWARVELTLGAHAGADVLVRFALEGGAGAVCAVAEAVIDAPRPEPTTVLLVTSDTHRADHLAAARGGVDVATPALDALASQGALFEDAFAPANVTLPSHAALLTGWHPRESGVLVNGSSIAPDAATLAERFAEAGFVTWAVTSVWMLGDPSSGLGRGFDRMSWPHAMQDRAARGVERLATWLPDADGRPLFVWLHLYDAHTPYDPPEPYRSLHDAADRAGHDTAHDTADDAAHDGLHDAPRDAPHDAARDIGRMRARYRGEVAYVDAQLGALLARPRLARAIVAFTADHGENLGEHGWEGNHHGLYPSTLHVPLVVRGPGVEPGRRVAGAARLLDVGRTLLDLADLDGAPFPGRDLLALPSALASASASAPRFALEDGGASASITHERWHLVLHLRAPARPGAPRDPAARHTVELYDLAADPRAERDLAEREPARARALQGVLVDWLAADVDASAAGGRDESMVREPGASAASPRVVDVERLAALGYVGGEQAPAAGALLDPACACAACARLSR